MNKGLKTFSRGLLAGLMVLAIAPISATKVFAEDATTTTAPTSTTNTDPENIQVNSDTITVDSTGKEVEKKDTAITASGTADAGTVTDAAGNKAEVTSGTDAGTSTVTLDENGNPVDTKVSTETSSTTKEETSGNTTTTTVTTTTETTTDTTVVDQKAIDAAGEAANTTNAQPAVYTYTAQKDGLKYSMSGLNDSESTVALNSEDLTHFKLNVTITKEAAGNQTINIGSEVVSLLNDYANEYGYKKYPDIPGDANRVVVNISVDPDVTNVYQYQNNSLTITSPDNSNEPGLSTVKDLTGNYIPFSSIGSIPNCPAIQELLGLKDYSGIHNDPTLLFGINDALTAKGYTGDNALVQYLLHYYNTKYNTNYTEYTPAIHSSLFDSTVNNIYNDDRIKLKDEAAVEAFAKKYEEQLKTNNVVATKQSDGTYEISFKWSDSIVAGVTYNYFYQKCLSAYYGDDTNFNQFSSDMIPHSKSNPGGQNYGEYYVEYSQPGSELYAKENNYFNGMGLLGNTQGNSSMVANLYLGLDGPNTGNQYMCYAYGIDSKIVLAQVNGDLTVNKINENGETITNDETGFNLYYLSGENGAGKEMYYALNENGTAYFTEDLTKAAILMTKKGNLTVTNLLQNTYYLKEVSAPAGYYINKTPLAVVVKGGAVATASFTDIAPITTTTTVKETSIVDTVTTTTRPTVTPTTNKDPEPTRPDTTPKTSTTTTTRVATPRTGDETNVPYAAGGFAVSMLVALMAVLLKKKVTE